MSIRKTYSLGKNERVRSRKLIDALFETGKKMTLFPFRLVYSIEQGKGELKAGFTVSAKNFPSAVDRNRIKRLTRESFRKQKKDLELITANNRLMVLLFFIYTGKQVVSYNDIYSSVTKILAKLEAKLNENGNADH